MHFNTGGDLFERLNKIFNILIAVPLVIIAFGYLEIYSGRFHGLIPVDSSVMTIVVIFIIIGLASILMRSHQRKVRTIPKSLAISERMRRYDEDSRSYYLKMFVLGMSSALFLLLFGEVAYAGSYAFLLFILSVNRPGITSIANHLGLEGKERSDFINNEPL